MDQNVRTLAQAAPKPIMKEQIVVIEDERDIQELISHCLERQGFRVSAFAAAEDALPLIRSGVVNLILLDVMLPGMDGFEFCRTLKADASLRQIPVIMVTALSEAADIVSGLEIGADDYLTKPFSPSVLVARIRSLLRRAGEEPSTDLTPITIDDLQIFPGRHQVLAGGREVRLSLTEFRILHFLARTPGWVFSRYQIIDGIRGDGAVTTDRVIDVHITGLRRKLGKFGDYVQTVRGVGYRFRQPS
jgi:two-component system alkaline phosphatase synthesis response regulator PhoP